MSEFSIIFIDDNFNAMSTLVQTMSVEFPQADVSRIFNDPDKGVQYVLDNLDKQMIVFVDWNYKGTTKKGLSLINEIGSAVNIEERPIQEAIMGNGQLISASKIPEKRSDFINKYAINHEEAYRIHLKKYKKTYLANKRKRQIKQLIYKNKTLSNILYKIYRIFK